MNLHAAQIHLRHLRNEFTCHSVSEVAAALQHSDWNLTEARAILQRTACTTIVHEPVPLGEYTSIDDTTSGLRQWEGAARSLIETGVAQQLCRLFPPSTASLTAPGKGAQRAVASYKGKGSSKGKKDHRRTQSLSLELVVPVNPSVQAQLLEVLQGHAAISVAAITATGVDVELSVLELHWSVRNEILNLAKSIVADELSHEYLWRELSSGDQDGVKIPMGSFALVMIKHPADDRFVMVHERGQRGW